jgi:hypothetical protein
MKKFGLLLSVLLLVCCAPQPTPDLKATETAIAYVVFATLTAQVPSPTTTPAATSTPTATLTPTATPIPPTATPTPTATPIPPTATPTPLPPTPTATEVAVIGCVFLDVSHENDFRDNYLLHDLLKGEGITAKYGNLADEDLFKYDLVVIRPPRSDYSGSEWDKLDDYVEAGGTVLILTSSARCPEYAATSDNLVKRFGMDLYTWEEMREIRAQYGVQSQEFLDIFHNYYQRGKVSFKEHPITEGVENLWLHWGTGYVNPVGEMLSWTTEHILEAGSQTFSVPNIPALLLISKGEGHYIISQNFLSTKDVKFMGMNGASLKLFMNIFHWAKHKTSSPAPQGYYAIYHQEIDDRIRGSYKLLFVRLGYDEAKNGPFDEIGQIFENSVENQLGINIDIETTSLIYNVGSPSLPYDAHWEKIVAEPGVFKPLEYAENFQFTEDVFNELKQKGINLNNYDVIVVITSEFASGVGCGNVSVWGYFAMGPAFEFDCTDRIQGPGIPCRSVKIGPYFIELYGETVQYDPLTLDPDQRKWETLEIADTDRLARVLMHELGHLLSFQEYLVPRHCIMSGGAGAGIAATPTYCEITKAHIAFTFIKRAEGLIYKAQQAGKDVSTAQTSLTSAISHYNNENYKMAIVKASDAIEQVE